MSGDNELGNNDDSNFGNPADFISSIKEGQEPAIIDVPDKIGEIATADFMKAYSQYTGVEDASYGDLQKRLRYKEDFESLQTKHNQLLVTSKENPFHSDLSKEMNFLWSNGATNDDIIRRLQMQSLDVGALSDKESIILAEKLTVGGNKKFPEAHWEEWYNKTYGNPLDENGEVVKLTGSQEIEVGRRSVAARGTLDQQKIDSGRPPVVIQKEQAQAKFNSAYNYWGSVSKELIMNSDKRTFTVDTGKDDKGKATSTSYDFPISAEDRQGINVEVAKYAAQNNFPQTKAAFDQLQKVADSMIWAKYGPQILQNFARDWGSKVKESTLQNQHNITPLHQNTKQEKPLTEDDKNNLQKQLKGMNPFG